MDHPTRYDLLKTAIARYDGYYNLCAVKASLLLTTNVILLAAMVSEEGGFGAILAQPGPGRALALLAGLLSLVSILFAVLVIASYLPRGSQSRDDASVILSTSVAGSTPDAYLERISALDEAAAVEDLARLAHSLAVGLVRKFQRINISLYTFLAATVVAVTAYAIA